MTKKVKIALLGAGILLSGVGSYMTHDKYGVQDNTLTLENVESSAMDISSLMNNIDGFVAAEWHTISDFWSKVTDVSCCECQTTVSLSAGAGFNLGVEASVSLGTDLLTIEYTGCRFVTGGTKKCSQCLKYKSWVTGVPA